MTEFLRVSGVYWGLTAMDLMGQLHRMNRDEVIKFVCSCQHDSGGFGATLNHDPHLLYTLSAIQVSVRECFSVCTCHTQLYIVPVHVQNTYHLFHCIIGSSAL